MRNIYMKRFTIYILAIIVAAHMSTPALYGEQPRLNEYPVDEFRYKEQSLYADFFDDHLFNQVEKALMLSNWIDYMRGIKPESQMINAFGEVPDSPFFTNRNYRKPLSTAELIQGANVTSGPDMSRPWRVLKGKLAGRNPGFFIEDGRGDKYLIKLDHKNYPEMVSSCEVIASKILYAAGYNVPQNTVCYFQPEDIRVDEGALFYNEDGFKVPFSQKEVIAFIKKHTHRNAKGFFRAVASKIIEGTPIGYVSFRSSREDDILDVIPHKDRRELRALRVFSAWINDNDRRRGNSLDVIIEEEEGWYIKHYLLDFGSTFGSHTYIHKFKEAGHVNVIDIPESLKAWLSLGLYKRPYYHEIESFSPAIGYFTNKDFKPNKWKPMIPNFAFDNMTNRDAFWAAKIIMSFSDEQIAALVSTGEYSNKEDEEYLKNILIERRDIIGWHYFRQINPLDNFISQMRANDLVVSFENLYEKYGFSESQASYHYVVKGIKANSDDETELTRGNSTTQSISIPKNILTGYDAYRVEIRTIGEVEAWQKRAVVDLNTSYEIAGISRDE